MKAKHYKIYGSGPEGDILTSAPNDSLADQIDFVLTNYHLPDVRVWEDKDE